jgi:hypothetical protein
VTVDEALEFWMEGSITDHTSVWTEGMDDWVSDFLAIFCSGFPVCVH